MMMIHEDRVFKKSKRNGADVQGCLEVPKWFGTTDPTKILVSPRRAQTRYKYDTTTTWVTVSLVL